MRRESSLVERFICFAGVGAVATAIQYMILFALVRFVNTNPVYASSVGFSVSALVNYFMNYHLTFKSKKRHRDTITKFLSLATIGLILNSLVMEACTALTGLHYLFAQAIATAIVLIWNFSGNSIWTFRESPATDTRSFHR